MTHDFAVKSPLLDFCARCGRADKRRPCVPVADVPAAIERRLRWLAILTDAPHKYAQGRRGRRAMRSLAMRLSPANRAYAETNRRRLPPDWSEQE